MTAHGEAVVAHPPARIATWSRPPLNRGALRRYAIALVSAAFVVFALGWFTHLRHAMHAALVTAAVFAFLPLVLIAAGFAVGLFLMILSLLAALVGGDGDPVVSDAGLAEIGVAVAPGYYRFLFARFVARRRHPIFWGIPSGILVGGLALWLVIGATLVPREIRTVEVLEAAQHRIDHYYATHGSYPDPTPSSHLRGDDVNLPGDVVTDGFGRPIEYRKKGMWKVASYALRSHGFDAESESDDLYASGATQLGRFLPDVDVEASTGKVSIRVRLEQMLSAREKPADGA